VKVGYWSLAAPALTLSLSCSHSGHRDLTTELKQESSSTGLALVQPNSNRFIVFPFDGEQRYFKSSFRQPLLVTFGKAGRMILWYRPPLLGEIIADHSSTGEATITAIDGTTVKEVELPVVRFSPEALSESSRRLAFTGTLRGPLQPNGLYWATFDFSESGFVGTVDGHPCCDWSPDGQFLAYESRGHIYIFDVSSGRSRTLVEGIEPNWNSDGNWIAFRGADGRASLITRDGAPVVWPIDQYRPNGPIRWSPDGRYVAFSEPIRWHIPILGAYNRIAIARVSDGAIISAADFGAFWPNYLEYHWMVGYHNFCRECTAESP
jgi:WD40 repeat protein